MSPPSPSAATFASASLRRCRASPPQLPSSLSNAAASSSSIVPSPSAVAASFVAIADGALVDLRREAGGVTVSGANGETTAADGRVSGFSLCCAASPAYLRLHAVPPAFPPAACPRSIQQAVVFYLLVNYTKLVLIVIGSLILLCCQVERRAAIKSCHYKP